MSRPDIEAIEARANAATAGPWMRKKYPSDIDTVRQVEWIGCDEPGHHDCAVAQTVALVRLGHNDAALNAEFIAHAREDIPDLIAEIRLLNGLIADALWLLQPASDPLIAAQNADRARDLLEHRAAPGHPSRQEV